MPGLSHVGSTHVLHFTVACIGFVMADFIVFSPTENAFWDSPFALLEGWLALPHSVNVRVRKFRG